MKPIILSFYTVLLLLFAQGGFAQKNNSDHWHYAGLVQAGIVAGSSDITITAQTVHGIEKNNWFTGIGIGYDDYGIAGIPLFVYGQKAFTQKRSRPFVYAQPGLQLPIAKGQWNDKSWNGEALYDLHTGLIVELGGGYLIGLGRSKKTALIFNAGYSYKINRVTAYSYFWNDFPPYGDAFSSTEKQTYHYRRIAIKIGFKF